MLDRMRMALSILGNLKNVFVEVEEKCCSPHIAVAKKSTNVEDAKLIALELKEDISNHMPVWYDSLIIYI